MADHDRQLAASPSEQISAQPAELGPSKNTGETKTSEPTEKSTACHAQKISTPLTLWVPHAPFCCNDEHCTRPCFVRPPKCTSLLNQTPQRSRCTRRSCEARKLCWSHAGCRA